jgi:sugar phosphate permease
VLGLAWLCQLCVIWNWFLIPSLATELYPVLELTQWRYTLIFTTPLMVSIVTTYIGGGLADRFGIRPTIFIAVILSGVCGLTRAFFPSFTVFLGLAVLLGVANSFVPPNLTKLVGSWFPKRQVGLATGIYSSAQAIGFSVGLITGPRFHDWREAFIYVGAITAVVAIAWLILGRNTPAGVSVPKTPFNAGIRRALTSRNIWLAAVTFFLLLGGFQAYTANLAKALVGVHGTSPAQAGTISSMLTWGALFGTLLVPVISDRVGTRRPFIYGGAIIAAICLYLAWYYAPGGATMVWIMLGGFCLGGMVPILFTLPLELPEIGNQYVGGSAALMNSLGNLGGALVPFAVTPLLAMETQLAYDNGFAVVAVLLALMALPAWFLIETGWRKLSMHR